MRGLALILAGGLALAACGQTAATTDPVPVEASAQFPDTYEGPIDILTVIDAGYPMYAVTARVEGYADPVELLLNDQGAELNGLDPDALAGQTVIASVLTENRAAMMSVTLAGRELFATAPYTPQPQDVALTGVLEGAEAVSGGDLPDVVTVTPPDGTFTPLEAFITPEMVAANGQTVTVHYQVRPMRSITSVVAAP